LSKASNALFGPSRQPFAQVQFKPFSYGFGYDPRLPMLQQEIHGTAGLIRRFM